MNSYDAYHYYYHYYYYYYVKINVCQVKRNENRKDTTFECFEKLISNNP